MYVCVLTTGVIPSGPITIVGALSTLGSSFLALLSDRRLEMLRLIDPSPRFMDCTELVDMILRTLPFLEGMIALFLSNGMMSSSAKGSSLRKARSFEGTILGGSPKGKSLVVSFLVAVGKG